MRYAKLGIAAFFFLTFALAAQEWWEGKPLAEWSETEAARMLENSPWGKTHTIVISNPTTPSADDRSFISIGRGDLEREKKNIFRLALLTAKPIRMALARDAQVKRRGNMLQSTLEEFVELRDEQHIIVLMTVSTVPAQASSFRGYWSTLMNLRTSDLKANTSLATNTGKTVYLSRYEPPREDNLGARFIFPRALPDGRPLVAAGDRELRFETFITLAQDRQSRGHAADIEIDPRQEHYRMDRIWMKYSLQKMVFEGRLEI